MKYWNMITTPTKIVFILWTLDSFYMLFSGESGVNFFQWLIVWIFGCFIFCGIAQLISSKKSKKAKRKDKYITEQEKAYLEYKNALNDMGRSFSDFFKEAYYVNAILLNADSLQTGYLFTYKTESKEQLDYLMSNQKEMFEKLDAKPTFKVLFDTTFQMEINNTPNVNSSFSQNDSCKNFDFDSMNGHDFEHFCAKLLKENNYINVEVTQGSGDHGIDITAEKDGITYAIQCKCYSKDIGNAAIQQAYTGKRIYKKDVAVVMTNRCFTPQAKEEAETTGVKLWDRSKLISMIENA